MRSIIKVLTCVLLALVVFVPIRTSWAHEYTPAEKKMIDAAYRDAHWTTVAAAACIGAYSPENAPEFGYLRDYGWKIVPHKVKKGKLEANFIVAKNKTRRGRDVYIVAFRGSASKSDWTVNLNTDKVPYGGRSLEEFIEYAGHSEKDKTVPMVHKGFNDYVNTVLETMVDTNDDGIDEVLFNEILANTDTRVLLTGHSLGGAVATLLAERLVSMGIDKDRVPVITFGTPAIGNAAFAEVYGDKIDLRRITNNADPVPGSLQTFFGGYKQFGKHHKYNLSRKLSDFQHDMGMYFDYSMREYYAALDKAEAAGVREKLPMQKLEGTEPLVAVWIGSSLEVDKRDYVPDIKRFIMNEYQMMLPRYVIVDTETKLYDDSVYAMEKFYQKARELGADYILIAEIDGRVLNDREKWYINMNQSVFTVDGRLITMNSFARFVSPVSGNIQATTFVLEQSREELKKHLTFVRLDQHASPRRL